MKPTFFFIVFSLALVLIVSGGDFLFTDVSKNTTFDYFLKPAYALSEIVSTKYVPNGYTNTFTNGTHRATLGLTSIQNGTDARGNPIYGPYVLTQNTTGYFIQTGDGSFFFDKITCDGYFYKAGMINATNNSPVIMPDRFFMLQKNLTASLWTIESQVTNQKCSTNIMQNATYVEIDGTKNSPGIGSVTVKYLKSYGHPFVSVISAKNQNPSWQNNHIALEERMTVPRFITLNHTMHDLSTLKNLNLSYATLKSFIYKDIDFGPYYAMLLDEDMNLVSNISFSFNSNSQLVDVIIDYTRDPSVVSTGNSFTIDPTLAYNTGTQWYISSQFNTYPRSYCSDVGPTYYNTLASSANTIIYQTAGAYCQGRILKIDTSSIPTYATINSVSFQYNVSSITGTPPRCALVDIMDNPSKASSTTIWSDMYGGANGMTNSSRSNHTSVSSDPQCDQTGGPYTDTLDTAHGIADMNTQVSGGKNFFAVAMTFNTTGINSNVEYPVLNGFQMQVVYSVPLPPSSPAGLVATPTSSQINLSWSAPSSNGGSPITGYKIERSADGGSTWPTAINIGNITSYSDTGLDHSTTYTYRISAINVAGTSSPSNNATATMFNAVSTEPLGLVAVANSTTQINLFWTEPLDNGGTPITGFKIERAIGTGSYSILVSNTGNNITKYLNSGLSSGTSYTYRVSAINSIGTSTPSLNSSSTTFVSSTDPRLDSSGEQRASYFDGTRNWIFYYDGSSNIIYRYTTNNGATLSDSFSTSSGSLVSNTYFSTYGESNTVIITWASTTNVFTKTGTISGTTISWSPSTSVFAVSGTNAGQLYYPSFEKVGSNLFLGFNVVTKGKNVGNVYVSTNLGSSWSSSTSLYSNQAQPGIVGIAKYSTTKALAIFAGYADSEFTYKTFSGTSWSSQTSSTTGAGLTANVLKTSAFSIASNGTCAWVGYLASNSAGPVKSMLFCDTTNISFPITRITSANLQPSLSDIGSEVRLLYQRGNSIYRITTANGLWGLESVAVQNTHNPTFLHAQKIGSSSSYLPVVWQEGAANPFTMRFAIDAGLQVPLYQSVWEDHNSVVGNQGYLLMTNPPLNTGADWWWARAFVYEAVMVNLNGEGSIGAGFAKYIPLGQTSPITAKLAYSYQFAPEVQTYYFGSPVSSSQYYAIKLMPNNCWNMYMDGPGNASATDCLENTHGNPVLINGGAPTYIVWSNTMQNAPGDFQDITVKKNINNNFDSLAKFAPNVYCTIGDGNIYNIKNITPGSETYELQFGSTTGPNSSCLLNMPGALGWELPG